MIWQQPIAWVGLLALALPVIIHLLGRGDARSAQFPSLRFIQRTRLLPTRRTRLRDLLLLAVRLATLAAAVAALAQPLWSTAERTRTLANSLSRAVVLDTSVGADASAKSLAVARRLADSASAHVLIATASPELALAGAISWLTQQPTRAELVVVSDFPTGQFTAEEMARIPRDIGVRLVRAAAGGTTVGPSGRTRATVANTRTRTVTAGDATIDVRASLVGAPEAFDTSATAPATSVAWESRRDGVSDDTTGLTLIGAAAEQPSLALAYAAARRSVAVPTRSTTADADATTGVTIVTPHAPGRAALLASSIPLRTEWMLDAVAALHMHALVRSAAIDASPTDSGDRVTGIPVVSNRHGETLVSAREAIVNGQHLLLLLSRTAAADFSMAALIAAVREVRADRRQVEREPGLVPDSVLRTWQRPPSTERRTPSEGAQFDADQGPSDGRWLWVVVLVLIGAEQLLRRNARIAPEPT